MPQHRRFYFLGELGVFVQVALGAFERHFALHPDAKVEVLTYPDYGSILVHLFPENIARILQYDGPPLSANRFGIGLAGNYSSEVDNIVEGAEDLRPLFAEAGHRRPFYMAKQRIPNESIVARAVRTPYAWAYFKRPAPDQPFFPVLPISKPLRAGTQTGTKRNICLLPRFRRHPNSNDRNIGAEFWNTLVGDHLTPAFGDRVTFVLSGLEAEHVKGFGRTTDTIRPKGILEEINLLNHAAMLISPLSGFGQLGSFCGADVLYVLPPEPIAQEAKHVATVHETNVFDASVTCLREQEILADPDPILTRIEDALSGKSATPINHAGETE